LDRLTPRLVLAEFFPWYATDTWNQPQFADRPLRPYSTDSPTDVSRLAGEAHSAGLDAFVISWNAEQDDARLATVLAAIGNSGRSGCAYTGTDVGGVIAAADADTMVNRLTHLVDRFGSHPAYLHYAGRPVIFTYIASGLSESDWINVIGRLHA